MKKKKALSLLTSLIILLSMTATITFAERFVSDKSHTGAVNWGNGKAYFFKGSQYIRYDIKADRADPGYPKPINAETWPGLWQ